MKTVKETIKERALQVCGIAIMIVAGILAVYALRIILWVGYCLGFVM